MRMKWCVGAGLLFLSIGVAAGCGQQHEVTNTDRQASAPPSTSQVPLAPTSIPKFAHELPIPRVYAPVIVGGGPTLHQEYTVSVQNVSRYQLTSESAMNVKLPEVARGVGMKLAFRDDYDNAAPAGRKNNDTRLTLSMTLDF